MKFSKLFAPASFKASAACASVLTPQILDSMALWDISAKNPNNTLAWVNTDPYSTWAGVTVDGNGRVTGIDFSSNLLDSIPSSIGHMTALTSLALGSNNLITLPTEIGSLSALTSLDLNNN